MYRWGKLQAIVKLDKESLSLGKLTSVSYCLNPQCPDPSNQPNPKARLCPHCGSELFLRGRYRIIQTLGGGGFGRTFEIEDNGVPKVLKVLYKNHPKAVTLFQQEAKVLSRLNHPGIPRVEEDGYFQYFPKNAKDPLHCLVMEKIEGSNLMDWLKARNHTPIDEAQAMAWLKQLVEILGQVHQQHYFHRDIKPHNIMRRPEGQLALIDFGTAREVTGTYLNKVGGGQNVTEIISAGYTPPEQINGKAVPQSDFYALGRTFVYLLTGRRPTEFPENPRTGKLLWRDGAPHISNELASVIDYMMAPFPGNRPQHAQMILKSLAEVEGANSTSNTSGRNTHGRVGDRTGSPTGSRANLFEVRSGESGFRVSASGLRSGTSGFKTGLPRRREPRWLQNVRDRLEDRPIVSILAGSLLFILASTQIYGMWRYSAFPSNPVKVIANIPSNWFLQKTLRQDGEVASVALSGDGKILASGSFGTIRLWDVADGELKLDPIAAHNKWVGSLVFSPDGKTLFSGSDDSTIRLWNSQTGARKLTIASGGGAVKALAVSPNGKILASGSADKMIRLWSPINGDRIRTLGGHQGAVNALAISSDGKILASASHDKTIKLWDLNQGILLDTLSGHSGAVLGVAISPDGKTVASASSDNTIALWELATGKRQQSLGGQGKWVRAVAFSRNGRHLVSAGETLSIWQPQTGELQRVLAGHDRQIDSIALGSDNRTVISGSDDRTLKIWRLPKSD
jgi:WD40 repeat protein/predicted Ser/Thr protein kinase